VTSPTASRAGNSRLDGQLAATAELLSRRWHLVPQVRDVVESHRSTVLNSEDVICGLLATHTAGVVGLQSALSRSVRPLGRRPDSVA
jgi:hypothetical protein